MGALEAVIVAPNTVLRDAAPIAVAMLREMTEDMSSTPYVRARTAEASAQVQRSRHSVQAERRGQRRPSQRQARRRRHHHGPPRRPQRGEVAAAAGCPRPRDPRRRDRGARAPRLTAPRACVHLVRGSWQRPPNRGRPPTRCPECRTRHNAPGTSQVPSHAPAPSPRGSSWVALTANAARRPGYPRRSVGGQRLRCRVPRRRPRRRSSARSPQSSRFPPRS